MCSLGRIKPDLLGKSYNMCWRIHEAVVAVISRLFQEQYVAPLISQKIIKQSNLDNTTLKNTKELREYYVKYIEMQKRWSAGEFGLTGKYWMLYVRDIDLIHQFHSVININDYYLRLENWEELMVLSFTMNKQNYARYGTYNLTQMASLDSTHR